MSAFRGHPKYLQKQGIPMSLQIRLFISLSLSGALIMVLVCMSVSFLMQRWP